MTKREYCTQSSDKINQNGTGERWNSSFFLCRANLHQHTEIDCIVEFIDIVVRMMTHCSLTKAKNREYWLVVACVLDEHCAKDLEPLKVKLIAINLYQSIRDCIFPRNVYAGLCTMHTGIDCQFLNDVNGRIYATLWRTKKKKKNKPSKPISTSSILHWFGTAGIMPWLIQFRLSLFPFFSVAGLLVNRHRWNPSPNLHSAVEKMNILYMPRFFALFCFVSIISPAVYSYVNKSEYNFRYFWLNLFFSSFSFPAFCNDRIFRSALLSAPASIVIGCWCTVHRHTAYNMLVTRVSALRIPFPKQCGCFFSSLFVIRRMKPKGKLDFIVILLLSDLQISLYKTFRMLLFFAWHLYENILTISSDIFCLIHLKGTATKRSATNIHIRKQRSSSFTRKTTAPKSAEIDILHGHLMLIHNF